MILDLNKGASPGENKEKIGLSCFILSYKCQVFELIYREPSNIFSTPFDPFEIL